MAIIDQFSSSQGRADQEPNQALAKAIASADDLSLLEELIQVLNDNKTTVKVKNDCVMTLMALSEIKAQLLINYLDELVKLLHSKTNRQVWGSLTALSNIAPDVPHLLRPHLSLILQKMEEGTIVGRDRGFRILIALYAHEPEILSPLILEQLLNSPDNQFGQYTERFLDVVLPTDCEKFEEVIEVRSRELINEYHQKRATKNLLKLRKKHDKLE